MLNSGEDDKFITELQHIKQWFSSSRFSEITRLYSAQQVAEQRGSIPNSFPIAKEAASAFYNRLRNLFTEKKSITTFGPYSPGQAVAMKRQGIEGIYLGGWATSAKGSITENPGPDLASYPLSQVPEEAAPIVRALLTADQNQSFSRRRMNPEKRASTQWVDYRPFIIADADTGHGGDAHVRNLVRRFVEVGVPGYHIEDQKPGCKKCGHQGGKVLVSAQEQITRLNAARFQLDIMDVEGIIVARTDAEAATLIDSINDERDHPFILGATNPKVPSYKVTSVAILKKMNEKGITAVNGHMLFAIAQEDFQHAEKWFEDSGLDTVIDQACSSFLSHTEPDLEQTINKITAAVHKAWEKDARLSTLGAAVADAIETRTKEGTSFEITIDEWNSYANSNSLTHCREKAKSMGLEVFWDGELARTPEGYYQLKGGIPCAISRSLAVSPFADILWMETKTADLKDAKQFADAIHAVYPEKMLAYNLSPSFNWDTTGMNDEEMKNFPIELGKMGFVFNFITYGGHQIDGNAGEDFAASLKEEGMLALARLQRRFRLIESPYKTPQSLVGGPRLDAALMAVTGRTATTKAMGKGSTQSQHLVQIEVPLSVLENWIGMWKSHYGIDANFKAELRPHNRASSLLELNLYRNQNEKIANVIFDTIYDRRNRIILSIRDQNNFEPEFRQKRLMTLIHLFLLHRYNVATVHYVTPTEANQKQTVGMKALGIYENVDAEIGQIIVATVDRKSVENLTNEDLEPIGQFIAKSWQPA